MFTKSTFSALLFISLFVSAQKIKHYDGKISIDDLKTVNADFKISYTDSSDTEFYLFVNKNASIQSLKIDNKTAKYVVEDATDLMPDLKKIVIQNHFPLNFKLDIRYTYPLDKIENPTFRYNPNWIELNLYTGWFPFDFEDKNYSYNLEFLTPAKYQIVSSGTIQKNGTKTIIRNTDNYKDMPVILSDKFQVFQPQNKSIKFYGVDLSDKQIADIKETSDDITAYFEGLYDKSDSKNLIITVNPFAHPMSYSRKGFISLSLKNSFANSDKKILAHEIGHLWWKNASFGTYEEWLNESFAEFSALKWSEKHLSKEDFNELLKKYESAYQNPTKISTINPDADNWYSLAYFKYPYILYKLEQKIGDRNMSKFLKAAYQHKISKTADLLKLLENYTDKKTVEGLRNEIYVIR